MTDSTIHANRANIAAPQLDSASRQLIEKQFSPHIQAINSHCAALESIIDDNLSTEPGDDLFENDLQKIRKGLHLLQRRLDTLALEGLINPDDSHVTPVSALRHDLRTPLNAIKGYTELLSDRLESVNFLLHDSHCRAILICARQLSVSSDNLCAQLLSQVLPPSIGASTDPSITRHLQRISEQHEIANYTGRILVVDDIEDNRVLLQRYLVPEGHQITLAESGVTALEMIETHRFDIILLDIMMPGMNGLQVLEILKATDEHRQIPIIVISGLSEVDAIAPCIAAGAEDYLTKPIDVTLLTARINSSLRKQMWGKKEREYLKQIEREKKRSDAILSAILPHTIIQRLKSSDDPIADRIDNVTVLFADIVGFTPAAERMAPEILLERLNTLFSGFDELCLQYGVEKIKTIGDAYMAACGVPLPTPDHIDRVLDLSTEILAYMSRVEFKVNPFQLRIGVHSGSVIAGLVGRHRYTYDLWGETVNFASRLESNGLVNRVTVSDVIVNNASHRFVFEHRGQIELKGIGMTNISMLKQTRP